MKSTQIEQPQQLREGSEPPVVEEEEPPRVGDKHQTLINILTIVKLKAL